MTVKDFFNTISTLLITHEFNKAGNKLCIRISDRTNLNQSGHQFCAYGEMKSSSTIKEWDMTYPFKNVFYGEESQTISILDMEVLKWNLWAGEGDSAIYVLTIEVDTNI